MEFDEDAAATRLERPDKDCEPESPEGKPLRGAARLERLLELGAARLKAGERICGAIS